jgi:hypothetical protein
MRKISSQTTFLYQVVWPIFCIFILLIMVKIIIKMPALIILGFCFVLVNIWIIPLFLKLKDVWLDNDYMVVSDLKGYQTRIVKKDIIEITQNESMITPRLIRIRIKSSFGSEVTFRFIPKGGYWIFWQHPIVNELNNWRLKD